MDNPNISDVSQLEKDSKVVHKRRSSIFQSRRISFNEPEVEGIVNTEKEDADKDIAEDTCAKEEPFNLEKYIISIRNERKEWIETLKRRKAERRRLGKQKICIESTGQPIDLNALTEGEKSFIMARPNYRQICKNYEQLSDVVVKLSALSDIAYKLNEKLVLHMEKKLEKLTEKIIEASEA